MCCCYLPFFKVIKNFFCKYLATFDNLTQITLFKCKQVVKVKKAVKQEEINFLLEN